MSFMFNTTYEQSKYNISTQFQLMNMWVCIPLDAGVGYLTVIGQRENIDTNFPRLFPPGNSAYQGHHSGWNSSLNYPPLVRSHSTTDLCNAAKVHYHIPFLLHLSDILLVPDWYKTLEINTFDMHSKEEKLFFTKISTLRISANGI